MSEQISLKPEQYILGRGEVKVPNDVANIKDFFFNLWEFNSVPRASTYSRQHGYGFEQQLVVPANEEKPLLFLTHNFEPAEEDGYWRNRYDISVPPQNAGSFELCLRVSVEYKHNEDKSITFDKPIIELNEACLGIQSKPTNESREVNEQDVVFYCTELLSS